jgi:hypothetical protein
MSDKLNSGGSPITQEQVEAVAGGADSCSTVDALVGGAYALPGVYEALIDFTSQVIERLATSMAK